METTHRPYRQRRLRAAVAFLVLALLGCGDGSAGGAPPAGSPSSGGGAGSEEGPAFRVETVAEGLVVPWDLAFAPDGRVFVTERPGRIRVLEDGVLRDEPWATLDVEATGEAGLMGIALDPDWEENGHVYVAGTFRGTGGLVNRVVRLTDRGGRGGSPTVLVDGLPSGRFHAGAAVDFGPDGLLYVTIGDAGRPSRAQDPDDLAGKLLRYTPEGAPAPDNGVGGPVHALGLRNPQGLAWHAGSGDLFASEHGPSGERGRGRDELNHVVPGANLGWPEAAGMEGAPRFREPLAAWTPAIAPSGIAVLGDHAYLGALRGEQLRRVRLERAGEGWAAGAQEALYENEYGRLRAVVAGPDGALWVTTSNRDGRGRPASSDDRVLRLVPEG